MDYGSHAWALLLYHWVTARRGRKVGRVKSKPQRVGVRRWGKSRPGSAWGIYRARSTRHSFDAPPARQSSHGKPTSPGARAPVEAMLNGWAASSFAGNGS